MNKFHESICAEGMSKNMEYEVIATRRAKINITRIAKYIATDLYALESAKELVTEIKSQILDLNFMPKRFALVPDERLAKMGMRSVPVKNYSIFYIVDEQTRTVTVISVMYSRRDWANLLFNHPKK
ncbi:MAG: type II toxin-antitoxin system RelE/ParE family toxin [Defluviitaleaceae bacterium]|nr:type II toxin-antitoxin system RelE/ParE family toxin [Defluviitaleaceae bacterium]